MWVVENFRFFTFFCRTLRALPNEVDEFCGIGSSEDVVQPFFHEQSPNNSWCQQNQAYCPGQYKFSRTFRKCTYFC